VYTVTVTVEAEQADAATNGTSEADAVADEELEMEEPEEELPLSPPVQTSSPIGVCAISASMSLALSTQRFNPLNKVMLSL
jgi:hypothetical protein